MQTPRGLDQLRQTLEALLGDEGCQWDRQQTHRSLVRYLIEEAYELVDAIETDNRDAIREELGDVLYQVLFHAEIARRDPENPFDIDSVAQHTDHKMRSRHPHVFGDVKVDSVEEIRQNWVELKRREKPARLGPLDGIPSAIQGIARAHQVLERATRVGVGPDANPDLAGMSQQQWGAWLLSAVATARAEGIDLDLALREALREFESSVEESLTTGDGVVPQ
jgi:XTP/dITP diphosphohydrolase